MTGDMVEEAIGFTIENGEKSEKKCEKMLEKWWKNLVLRKNGWLVDKNTEKCWSFPYIGMEKLAG